MNTKYSPTNTDQAIIAALTEIASVMQPVARKRVAAAITYKNTTIIGTSSNRSDPFAAKLLNKAGAIYHHAETSVIKSAIKVFTPRELRRATLYVLRLKYVNTNRNQLIRALAKPCLGCQRAIKMYEIGRIIFTTDEGALEIYL